MKTRMTLRDTALAAALLLVASARAHAGTIDRVIGANAPNGGARLVKHFTVASGATITGLEFVSNDLRTVFPKVVLLRGEADRFSEATIVAELTNVRPSGSHHVRLSVSPMTVASTQDFYLAVTLPASSGVREVGIGPGLAGTQLNEPGNGNYMASAADGEFQAIDVDLAMSLTFQGAGKASAGEPNQETNAAPLGTFLEVSTPSPAGAITVEFGVDRLLPVSLWIYDIAGRQVQSLADGPLAAGRYSRSWDGQNRQGQQVAAGIYFVRLRAGEKSLTQKLVLMK